MDDWRIINQNVQLTRNYLRAVIPNPATRDEGSRTYVTGTGVE
jgi:hypothetical protein